MSGSFRVGEFLFESDQFFCPLLVSLIFRRQTRLQLGHLFSHLLSLGIQNFHLTQQSHTCITLRLRISTNPQNIIRLTDLPAQFLQLSACLQSGSLHLTQTAAQI